MKERKKRSVIWRLPTADLKTLVEKSTSLGQILRYFGIPNKGGNSKTLKNRLLKEGIDFSRFKMGIGSNKGRKFPSIKKPLAELLVKDSTYNRCHLKTRLLKEGLLEERCSKCNLLPEWQGEKLVLILDHINGISNDHRIENLRLLCPNCNSQTSTFAGRNIALSV